jgi:adenylate kinase
MAPRFLLNLQNNTYDMKPITLAFDGISGSGKGTQAELLMKVLRERDPNRKIVHFGMGELLRAFWNEGTALAKRTQKKMTEGELLPSVLPSFMIASFFNKADFQGDEHLIIDGAVRRVDQAKSLDELVRFYDRTEPVAIIFDLSPEDAYERLHLRGRSDDTREAIEKRARWFQESALPAVETLKALGWQVHRINAHRSVEEIHKDVLAALGL